MQQAALLCRPSCLQLRQRWLRPKPVLRPLGDRLSPLSLPSGVGRQPRCISTGRKHPPTSAPRDPPALQEIRVRSGQGADDTNDTQDSDLGSFLGLSSAPKPMPAIGDYEDPSGYDIYLDTILGDVEGGGAAAEEGGSGSGSDASGRREGGSLREKRMLRRRSSVQTTRSNPPTRKWRLHKARIAAEIRLYKHIELSASFAERRRFRNWRTKYSRICETIPYVRLKLDGKKELERLLVFETAERMRSAWLANPQEHPLFRGHDLVAVALRSRRWRAPLVLGAIFDEHETPFYLVRDAFRYLVQWSLYLPTWRRHQYHELLCHTLLFILRNSSRGYVRLKQMSIVRIIANLRPELLDELFVELRKHGHLLHHYTLARFCLKLSNDPRYKSRALEILAMLLEEKRIDRKGNLASRLARGILRLAGREDAADWAAQTWIAPIYEGILKLGLRFNEYLYNVMIKNLCQSGDLEGAWRVYDIMRGEGIAPHHHPSSLTHLVNGSKKGRNFDSLGRAVAEIAALKLGDQHVLNDLLHACLLEVQHEGRQRQPLPPRSLPAFGLMLQFYRRFFRVEPLQALVMTDLTELGDQAQQRQERILQNGPGEDREWDSIRRFRQLFAMVPSNTAMDRSTSLLESSCPTGLLEPSCLTLRVMIVAYVKGFSKLYSLVAFYSHFRNLLKSGDPVVATVVSGAPRPEIVYDVLIKSICEWKGMFRVALDVVGDMLKDGAARATALSAAKSRVREEMLTKSMAGEVNTSASSLHLGDETQAGEDKGQDMIFMSGDIASPDDIQDDDIDLGIDETPGSFQVQLPPNIDDVPRHPPPSLSTWTTLLGGFLHSPTSDAHRGAEHILRLMQEHGVKPSRETWNVLVAGYARIQRVDNTIHALQMLERAGEKPDEWTIKAFRELSSWNRKLALEKMDKMVGDSEREVVGTGDGQEEQPEGTSAARSEGSDLGPTARTDDGNATPHEMDSHAWSPVTRQVLADDYEDQAEKTRHLKRLAPSWREWKTLTYNNKPERVYRLKKMTFNNIRPQPDGRRSWK